ncbi:MAG: hypothetical protein IJA18_00675, partial [Ruminococcus sp.]|nr:hypothetical protein [Ruminococcus sp.]
KLAAKLTGFKIDIKPRFDTVTNQETEELSPDYVVPGMEEPVNEALEEYFEMDEAAPVEEAPAAEEAAENAAADEAAENSGEYL